MRGFGEGRVTLALFRLPRISARAAIRAIPYVIEDNAKRDLCVEYIGNALQILTDNTAHAVNGGRYLTNTLTDLLHPEREDKRTAQEIANDLVKRMGLHSE